MKHSVEEVREKLEWAEGLFDRKTKVFKSERYQQLAREGVVSPPFDLGWWLGFLDGIRWLLHERPRKKQLRDQYHKQWPDIPEEHIEDDDDWETRKLKNIGYKQGYGHALKWEISAYATPLWRSYNDA